MDRLQPWRRVREDVGAVAEEDDPRASIGLRDLMWSRADVHGVRLSPLRQSRVREPSASLSWHAAGQHRRHDREGSQLRCSEEATPAKGDPQWRQDKMSGRAYVRRHSNQSGAWRRSGVPRVSAVRRRESESPPLRSAACARRHATRRSAVLLSQRPPARRGKHLRVPESGPALPRVPANEEQRMDAGAARQGCVTTSASAPESAHAGARSMYPMMFPL